MRVYCLCWIKQCSTSAFLVIPAPYPTVCLLPPLQRTALLEPLEPLPHPPHHPPASPGEPQ